MGVPVSILVIMPKVAQHAVDVSPVAFTNSTLLPCDNFNSAPYMAEVKNDMQIDMLGSPLGADLELNEVKLSAYMCPDGAGGEQAGTMCKEPHLVELGTFQAPSQGLSVGENQVKQVVSVDVTNHTTLLSGFIFPLALDPNSSQTMTVEASDVTVKILGIPVTKLSFSKSVKCKSTQYTTLPVQADMCSGRGGAVSALSMTCFEDETSSSLSSSVLQQVRQESPLAALLV